MTASQPSNNRTHSSAPEIEAAHRTSVIFVTGASRSGTTMLARVFSKHSMIHSSNELHYFGDVFDTGSEQLSDSQLTEMAANLIAREIDGIWRALVDDSIRERARSIVSSLEPEDKNGFALFAKVMENICDESGKSIACDHTPRNIFYAARLLDQLPNARVIHMVRDPRAVLASQKHRWKRRWLDSVRIPLREALRNRVAFHPFTTTRLWAKATHQAVALSEHPRFMAVKFEDLINDPDTQLKTLCEFLGIPLEDALYDVQVMGSSHNTSRLSEHKFDRETLQRWRSSLRDDEIVACEKRAASLMRDFDYRPVSDIKDGLFGRVRQTVTFPLHLVATALIDPKRVKIQIQAMMRAR